MINAVPPPATMPSSSAARSKRRHLRCGPCALSSTGCGTDLITDTPPASSQTFLQFFTISIGAGCFDFRFYLGNDQPRPGLRLHHQQWWLLLVTVTRRAVPRTFQTNLIQLHAQAFETTCTGQVAMSCNMALRRSPKPGLRQTLGARSLLTTGSIGFTVNVFSNDEQRFLSRRTFSSSGKKSWTRDLRRSAEYMDLPEWLPDAQRR